MVFLFQHRSGLIRFPAHRSFVAGFRCLRRPITSPFVTTTTAIKKEIATNASVLRRKTSFVNPMSRLPSLINRRQHYRRHSAKYYCISYTSLYLKQQSPQCLFSFFHFQNKLSHKLGQSPRYILSSKGINRIAPLCRSFHVLGIESSCDDSALAVINGETGEILYSALASQWADHATYGGIVPSLAARAHDRNLPVLLQNLRNTKVKRTVAQTPKLHRECDKTSKNGSANINVSDGFDRAYDQTLLELIDVIAVTRGPGLAPCLHVGINAAIDLAHELDKPLVCVNHLQAHALVACLPTRERQKQEILEKDRDELDNASASASVFSHSASTSSSSRPIAGTTTKCQHKKLDDVHEFNIEDVSTPAYPFLAMIVSGGHSIIVLIRGYESFRLIGSTLDDSVGEAFDKVARLLNLAGRGVHPELNITRHGGSLVEEAAMRSQNHVSYAHTNRFELEKIFKLYLKALLIQ